MTIKSGFLLVLVGVAAAGIACEGPSYAFNERSFELPSMKPGGGGCMTVQLGSRSRGGTGTADGSGGSTLAVVISSGGDVVTVTVTEGGRLLEQRTYDEAFLRSGRVDEFTVTASTGQSRLLRYWSSFDDEGQPRCAPLEEDGPRLP